MSRARATPVHLRRRSKPSLGARVRIFWVVLMFVGIFLGAAAYALATWPGFYPRIADVDGIHHVTAREVVQAAGFAERTNLWLQSKRAAQERIEAIPYVKTAQIHRTLPAKVSISVTEREPIAAVRLSDGTRALLDAQARILQRGVAGDHRYVEITQQNVRAAPAGTFIADAQMLRLVNDVVALAKMGIAVRSVSFERYQQLAVVTGTGLRVQFGDDGDLAEKVRLIDPILKTVGDRLGRVSALDLRAPKTPIVVYR